MKKAWMLAFSGVACLAAAANGQSLDLIVEIGGFGDDYILGSGEVVSVTVSVQGDGGPEAYRALTSLFGFSMSGFGAGTFVQTGINATATALGPAGLVYDHAGGGISMEATGGFVQLAGLLPTDNSNPIFLFSFDWTPSAYYNFWIDWSASATHGQVYVGGDANDPASWVTRDVANVGGANVSIRMVPVPSAAAVLGLAGVFAARRRR